jgi:hypothetical protein
MLFPAMAMEPVTVMMIPVNDGIGDGDDDFGDGDRRRTEKDSREIV